MVRLAPLVGHVVAPGHAAGVVAPPYDTLTPDQRRELAGADPDSFLRVLPSGAADEAELRRNRRELHRLLDTGRFVPMRAPSLGVLTLETADARAVAVLGDLEVAAFRDGRVLPHERIRPDRVAQLVRHLEVVGIASSPVCAVHRPAPEVGDVTDELTRRRPWLVLDDRDGTRLTLHLVTAPGDHRALTEAVDAAGTLFVADGHHRAAAVAERVATLAESQTPVRGDARPDTHRTHRVLTAVVPSDQLRVLAFHRRLDLGGRPTPEQVLGRLRTLGVPVAPLDAPGPPPAPGIVHLTVAGRWWALDLRQRRRPGPVEGLDVRLVERELLPALRELADDPGTAQLEPVAGPLGPEALVREGSIGLALHPPAIDDVLAVAEAGEVMPPKSTYLVPKLRSGLVVVPR